MVNIELNLVSKIGVGSQVHKGVSVSIGELYVVELIPQKVYPKVFLDLAVGGLRVFTLRVQGSYVDFGELLLFVQEINRFVIVTNTGANHYKKCTFLSCQDFYG